MSDLRQHRWDHLCLPKILVSEYALSWPACTDKPPELGNWTQTSGAWWPHRPSALQRVTYATAQRGRHASSSSSSSGGMSFRKRSCLHDFSPYPTTLCTLPCWMLHQQTFSSTVRSQVQLGRPVQQYHSAGGRLVSAQKAREWSWDGSARAVLPNKQNHLPLGMWRSQLESITTRCGFYRAKSVGCGFVGAWSKYNL